MQAQQGDRAPQTAALVCRVHGDGIHLASAGGRFVAAIGSGDVVDLCPVEARDGRALAGAGGDDHEQAGRVEPGQLHPGLEIGDGQPTLLGVVDEGGGVDRDPGLLIRAGAERAHHQALGELGRRQGVVQGPAEDMQFADRCELSGSGKGGSGLAPAVGPQPHSGRHC